MTNLFTQYQWVRLKRDRTDVSEHPFTWLEPPRAVLRSDRGVVVEAYGDGYDVEFFDEQGQTVDLLTVREDEIEAL